jgi:hypothetical protein
MVQSCERDGDNSRITSKLNLSLLAEALLGPLLLILLSSTGVIGSQEVMAGVCLIFNFEGWGEIHLLKGYPGFMIPTLRCLFRFKNVSVHYGGFGGCFFDLKSLFLIEANRPCTTDRAGSGTA